MSSKTPTSKTRDIVLKGLHPFLKERGYKKSGATFNRITSDGLTHVINLQISRLEPAGTVEISGMPLTFYGKVTVNLGVYVPEVALRWGPIQAKGCIQEYFCSIRMRLGNIGPERTDLWWELHPDALPIEDLQLRLNRDGLPFLQLYESRDAILRALEGNDGWHISEPHFVKAAILAARGEKDQAHTLLQNYLTEITKAPLSPLKLKHLEVINAFAGRLGLRELLLDH